MNIVVGESSEILFAFAKMMYFFTYYTKREELITLNNDIIILEDKIYYRVYYYGTVENILDAIVYGAEFIISNGKLYVANLI